ncbi:MAG: hypothetical protein GQ527_10990, partial [Bacteroidales bacterium]|nr:hypothetical protein [Bacteroidales bacterium]
SATNFNSIDIGGAFEIELIKSNEEKVVIEADDNIMPHIIVKVSGGELDIYTERNMSINNPNELKLTIYYKHINELDISGAAQLYSSDVLKTASLEMDFSGASEVTLKLDVEDLDADFSGASKVELEGQANRSNLDISGAAYFRAYGLEIKTLDLDASGASVVKVLVLDKIRIDASGASSVRYKGSPSIDIVDISGASSVRKG